MRIHELLLKNFGKFTDRRIIVSEGIQILYGENESGKSTVHTFIKAMLFGLGAPQWEIHSPYMSRGRIRIIILEG